MEDTHKARTRLNRRRKREKKKLQLTRRFTSFSQETKPFPPIGIFSHGARGVAVIVLPRIIEAVLLTFGASFVGVRALLIWRALAIEAGPRPLSAVVKRRQLVLRELKYAATIELLTLRVNRVHLAPSSRQVRPRRILHSCSEKLYPYSGQCPARQIAPDWEALRQAVRKSSTRRPQPRENEAKVALLKLPGVQDWVFHPVPALPSPTRLGGLSVDGVIRCQCGLVKLRRDEGICCPSTHEKPPEICPLPLVEDAEGR